jgi:hypothetical protein
MALRGRWSVLLQPLTVHPIVQRFEDNLPPDIFLSEVATEEDLLLLCAANAYCSWLDDVHRNGRIESANWQVDCKQPRQRTVSKAEEVNVPINNPRDGLDEVGRSVSRLNLYTCQECPKWLWMCRPSTNEEYGAVMMIRMEAWPYLSEPSRIYSPNMWQYVMYQRMLHPEIGWHRDNYDRETLRRMKRGEEPYRQRTVGGIAKSQ